MGASISWDDILGEDQDQGESNSWEAPQQPMPQAPLATQQPRLPERRLGDEQQSTLPAPAPTPQSDWTSKAMMLGLGALVGASVYYMYTTWGARSLGQGFASAVSGPGPDEAEYEYEEEEDVEFEED